MTVNKEKARKPSKIMGTKKLEKVIVGISATVFIGFFLFVLFLFSLIAVPVMLYSFPTLGGGKVAPGITKAKIVSLKIGMSKDTVISILGEPIYPTNPKDRASIMGYSSTYLEYATPGLSRAGFMIYLDITDNKLSKIDIRRGDGCIYFCNRDQCPETIRPEQLAILFSLSAK